VPVTFDHRPSDYITGAATAPSHAPASQETLVRVLHINSGNMYGGVETILVTLARLRHLYPCMEPHFALCHQGMLSDELAAAHVPVHILGRVRISRPWTVWRARRRLRELLLRERYDLVICHMPWSLAVFGRVVHGTGTRLGFWAHSFHFGHNWLERWARHAQPDLAIANSRFTAAGISNLFPAAKPGVVYPPVALAALSEHSTCRAKLRNQQGLSASTVVILHVSRMEEGKGHLLHLEALAQLKHLETPWVCWIVGGAQTRQEEEYARRLELRARELNLHRQVQFLGQRADIHELLAGADIFCQPNQSPDSFGITFVEALWAGRPVVTTAMGGALEILDQACGFLVKPDATRVAEALRALIESPQLRESLGRSGAVRAKQLCDPGRQMQVLADLAQSATRRMGNS
jgi:glycosyltransferase involved in cell wall biosynthesis